MASALLASLKTQEVVNSLRLCCQSEGIAADTAFTKSLLAESTTRITADAAVRTRLGDRHTKADVKCYMKDLICLLSEDGQKIIKHYCLRLLSEIPVTRLSFVCRFTFQ